MNLDDVHGVLSVLDKSARFYVMEGDGLALMRMLPDRSVHHVIADPPYEQEAHTKQRRVRDMSKYTKGKPRGLKTKPISFDPIDERTRADMGVQSARIAKRWVLIFCQVEGVPLWRAACEPVGLRHARSCVWIKADAQPQYSGDRPGTGYEMIEALHRPGKMRWNGGGHRGVFDFPCESRARTEEDHDTKKPLPLMLDLIEKFTDRGDLIIDPFCGGGSTGIAALRLGRRFLGADISPKWATEARAACLAEVECSSIEARRRGQTPLFAVGGT